MDHSTIFAVATARGRAGVAVIRISGPDASRVVQQMTRLSEPRPRRAYRSEIMDGHGETIDDGLVIWFPGPHSFTGEDVLEFHVHGGRAVIDGVLSALGAVPGLRPAEPGEFTKRAFIHGKMDLTAAEGQADLVAAETEAQRRLAFRQLRGDLGRLYEDWRDRLIRGLAYLEATIDFADEEIPDDLDDVVGDMIQSLSTDIAAHLADGHRGERLREGIEIAIVGAPNAGKSTLLNALARREAAIVSPHPGTTRDVIEVALDLGGYPVILADTAGLRDGAEAVEAEGVRRARDRAANADLILAVFDGQDWPDADAETVALVDADRALVVVSKSDVAALPMNPQVNGRAGMAVSAKTGSGLDALGARISEMVEARFGGGETPSLTRQRHRTALHDAHGALTRAICTTDSETRAQELRVAAHALGTITGRVGVEDVLDVIFRDFCIGK